MIHKYDTFSKIIFLDSSHDYLCNVNQLGDCAMSAGYTGHFNNLDYSICIQEEYGFCGIEYYPEKDELGSFSMTNKTELFIDEENKSHTGYFMTFF